MTALSIPVSHTQVVTVTLGDRRDNITSLYESDFAAVARIAYLIVGSAAVAEELAQDAFVAALTSRSLTNPAGFVRTVVSRKALTWLRRHRLESAKISLAAAAAAAETVSAEPKVDTTWPAVLRLRPHLRAVVVLRFYLGLPHADIAGIVGCATGTVRTRLHRALVQLRAEVPYDK